MDTVLEKIPAHFEAQELLKKLNEDAGEFS